MKEILKNKYLMSLLFVIFLFFIFSFNNSYGASVNLPSFSNLISDNDEYIVVRCGNNVYRLLVFDKNQGIQVYYSSTYSLNLGSYVPTSNVYDSNEHCISLDGVPSFNFKLFHVNKNTNSWELSLNGSDYSVYNFLLGENFDKNTGFIYSSFDIYTPSGKGYPETRNELVFQKAPILVGQVTIPKITQVGEIPQTMNKVLAIMIPIGLIVFFAGLLIYLVRLVILRMT